MTTFAANRAANDNSAREATRTPFVEQFSRSQQIGTLVNIVQKDTDSAQPNTTGPRTWLRRILGGGQIVETCPTWCTDHHRGDDHGTVDDLQHGAYLPGLGVEVHDGTTTTVTMPVLAPRIAVDPYDEDPARRAPHVLVEVWQDAYTPPLGPDGLVDLIGRLRAHADRLEQETLTQLVAARAEGEGGCQ